MGSLSENLVNPYHAFAILVGVAFAAAVLWPESAPAAFVALMRGPFLHHAVALFVGFLGLQIGEAEHGYGTYLWLWRARRLAGLVGFGLVLALPFLLVHRVETGLPWPRFAAMFGFLFAYGLLWALVGYGLAATVNWDGLRFVLKYAILLLIAILPSLAGLPLSPFPTVEGIWAGTKVGWGGFILYGALDLSALGAWRWASKRFSRG